MSTTALNFDPRLRRSSPVANATPISAPQPPPVDVGSDAGAVPGAPLDAARQAAAFEQAHPFAPQGSFTPAPVNASPAPGLYAGMGSDRPPVASSDPYADERGAGEAQAMQRMVMPGLYPASGFNGVAEVRNAARASGASPYGLPAAGGGRGVAGGNEFGLEGEAAGLSPVLTAALGLQQLKRQEVVGDVMANMASAGALLNPETDTPEIRSRKLRYQQSRLDATAANALNPSRPLPRAPGTPMYTGDLQPGQAGRMTMGGKTYAGGPGGIPSALELARTSTEIPNLNAVVGAAPPSATQTSGNRGLSVQLAETAERLRNNGRQPRLVTLGTDSHGRAVEGVRDPNGNFSRISAPNEGAGTQLNQLIKERENYAKVGNQRAVEQYDVAIANFGQQYDITGQPIRRGTSSAETVPPVPGAPVPPGQTPRELSQTDQQALTWARANANDERAKAILKRLGMQ